MNKVIIVGGGAAGMLCSIIAARNGCEVFLYEKNEKLGKKLYITGKGRCNVTNNCEVEDLLRAVMTNSKFLYSAFYTFNTGRSRYFPALPAAGPIRSVLPGQCLLVL